MFSELEIGEPRESTCLAQMRSWDQSSELLESKEAKSVLRAGKTAQQQRHFAARPDERVRQNSLVEEEIGLPQVVL